MHRIRKEEGDLFSSSERCRNESENFSIIEGSCKERKEEGHPPDEPITNAY